MWEVLKPIMKDPTRVFGLLDRELIYYRDKKRCAVCNGEMIWSDVEIHHVAMHSKGGKTILPNGAPVHKQRHPKGTECFVISVPHVVPHSRAEDPPGTIRQSPLHSVASRCSHFAANVSVAALKMRSVRRRARPCLPGTRFELRRQAVESLR